MNLMKFKVVWLNVKQTSANSFDMPEFDINDRIDSGPQFLDSTRPDIPCYECRNCEKTPAKTLRTNCKSCIVSK